MDLREKTEATLLELVKDHEINLSILKKTNALNLLNEIIKGIEELPTEEEPVNNIILLELEAEALALELELLAA